MRRILAQFSKKKELLQKLTTKSTIFKLKMEKMEALSRIVKKTVCIHQGHRRLGHRDSTAIKRLMNEGLATRIKMTECGDEIVCEHCIVLKTSWFRRNFL